MEQGPLTWTWKQRSLPTHILPRFTRKRCIRHSTPHQVYFCGGVYSWIASSVHLPSITACVWVCLGLGLRWWSTVEVNISPGGILYSTPFFIVFVLFFTLNFGHHYQHGIYPAELIWAVTRFNYCEKGRREDLTFSLFTRCFSFLLFFSWFFNFYFVS